MVRHRPRAAATATCWTCRLRHKKCDKALPRCHNCVDLAIPCYSASPEKTKPEWMDGGAKQREMAERIKDKIKCANFGRRERQNAGQARDSVFVINSHDSFSRQASTTTSTTTSTVSGDTRRARTPPKPSQETKFDNPRRSARLQRQLGPSPISLLPRLLQPASDAPLVQYPSLGLAYEQDFVMIYLDYVFPFLFPFYRPPLVATSRSWLLSFIQQSEAVRHSVLSMSSFFFTIGIKDVFGEIRAAPCKGTVWREVMKHADGAFALLQADLAKMARAESAALDKIHMVQTVMQLLVFDISIGANGWEAHLKLALSLLNESLRDGNGLSGVLESLEWVNEPLPPSDAKRRRLWNPVQSGLRFFTGVLITVDILASTALETAPSLQAYHRTVLADVPAETIADGLDLHTFVGCRNWALVAIGDIAALHAWKKQNHRQCLQEAELQSRSNRILQSLNTSIEQVESLGLAPGDSFVRQLFYTTQPEPDVCTTIWAYSARIYLNIVHCGWNPGLSCIQQDAMVVRHLFSSITSIAQLHTYAWPLCIAGCVTQVPERQVFKSLLDGMAQHKLLLQSIYHAMEIVEAVWRCESIDDTWDIAACLNILGSPALLF